MQGFYASLKNFLGLPDHFQSVIFSSGYEFRSFLADAWFGHRSYHPVHGNSGEDFIDMLKTRKYHPVHYPVKNGEYAAIPDGSSVFVVMNEADSGSRFGTDLMKKIKHRDPHGFIHADISSDIPGESIHFDDLHSFSFCFNTSFGLPFSEVIWFISRKLFNDFMLKYEGRFPADKLCTDAEPCTFYNNSDYFFLDVARKVIDDLNQRGLKNIVNETIYKSAILKNAVSLNPSFIYSVKAEKLRSHTTIVLDYVGKSAKVSEELLKSGFVVDALKAGMNEQRIRITNFPVHSREQFEALSDLVEKMR
jgi:phosphoserine aminotransferase